MWMWTHKKGFIFLSFSLFLVLQCSRIIHCGRASVNDYVVECLQASTPFSLLWINATEFNLKDPPASCGLHLHTHIQYNITIWLNWTQVNLFCCYHFIIIWCVVMRTMQTPSFLCVSKNEKQQANIFFRVTLCCCCHTHDTTQHSTAEKHTTQHNTILIHTMSSLLCERISHSVPIACCIRKYLL